MVVVDEWGVQQDYIDADGRAQRSSDATVGRVRELIGRPPADLEEWAPVVTRRGRATGLHGTVRCEDGTEARLDDVVPADLPFGYHDLTTDAGVERRLVVSPGTCVLPEQRGWGWAVQLYGAQSSGSASIGDLADLRTIREWTEREGGRFLVLNPLHAVAPGHPQEPSPYLPATRRFRNPLYLRVDDAGPPDPHAAPVDRDAAWDVKLPALRRAFERAPDDPAFTAWRQEKGRQLEEWARWSVLALAHGPDWHAWPAELHDPASDAVRTAAPADDVAFHAWLQWRLDVQLREATGDLTVVQDLPVGVHGGGADAWVWQDVMADGAVIGCPPDALNSVGQDWGSPPLVPWRLRAAGYQPFVESVRATIAGAGGLRVDHVMGLFRLWWIPDGEHAAHGCYVRYPAEDLLDIVCLESHRAGAVVVGEDLGTVEDGVREALAARGILGYRVLWFEDDDPADWPELAMAAVTTHDLPTVAGLWTGSDTADVLASSDMDADDVERGREELLARLRRDGLPATAGVDDALAAAYRQLGRAPSLLLTLSLEDALAEELRPNVPGTTARDNWRVPLAQSLEDMVHAERPRRIVEALGG
jgi:4-alpha-glucanotransferase